MGVGPHAKVKNVDGDTGLVRAGLAAGALLACVTVLAATDGLDPAQILKPLSDSWPTYSGDYTGRRYSSLKQIDQSNVKHMTLAWSARLAAGAGPEGGGRGNAQGPPFGPAPTIVGGEGKGDVVVAGGITVKGAILAVDMANYSEDRRTLALLRIRGASPASMWRFVVETLLSPALVGLGLGAGSAVLAGFGLANYVWRLREIRTVVQLLPTRLVVAPLTAWIALLLVVMLVGIASGFSWWVYRDTAHAGIRD